jgi:hypothetical protein
MESKIVDQGALREKVPVQDHLMQSQPMVKMNHHVIAIEVLYQFYFLKN